MPIDLFPEEKGEPKCVPDSESLKLENLVNDVVDGLIYGIFGGLMFLLFSLLSDLVEITPEDLTTFRISALAFMGVGALVLCRIRLL